jgi:hypothetical protein
VRAIAAGGYPGRQGANHGFDEIAVLYFGCMQLRQAAIGLSAGRALLGLVLLVAPEPVAKGWLGPKGAEPAAAMLARSVGVRDVALGAGAAIALLGDDDSASAWLAGAALCDLGDIAATLIARDALPTAGVRGTIALAGGSAVLAALAAARS